MSETPLTVEGRLLQERESSFKTCSLFFWIVLFFTTASTFSLGAALFAYGRVFELEYTMYSSLYSFVTAFPLLGIFISVFFPFVYTLNLKSCSKAAVYVVTIFYVLLVAAIVGYMIYDWIVNCDAGTAALHCWDGLAVRWQFLWVFFSIAIQLVSVVMQILITLQVLSLAQRIARIRAGGGIEMPTKGKILDNNVSGNQLGFKTPLDHLVALLTAETIKMHQ